MSRRGNYFVQRRRATQQRASAKRRERLIRARSIATHDREEWESLLEECEAGEAPRGTVYLCPRCLTEWYKLQKDHIVPISWEEARSHDGIDNIQPMCRDCNSSKNGDEAIDWLLLRRCVGWVVEFHFPLDADVDDQLSERYFSGQRSLAYRGPIT